MDMLSDDDQAARRARAAVGKGWRARFALHAITPTARRHAYGFRTPVTVKQGVRVEAEVLVQASSSVEDLSIGAASEPERDVEFEADEAIDSEDEQVAAPPPPSAGRLMERFACVRR
ncbi:hypothetical protein AURDEDRAFT_117035 [Auricularia subglabra TFB-10046 SS5]|nr:hypothetical protein AURDEDRAFT_117035 [Auricularia subglabra TFB-10046 SS5]